MSNYHGPWLVDIVAAVVSMALVVLFLRVWQPTRVWTSAGVEATGRAGERCATWGDAPPRARQVIRAWMPWLILSVLVFIVGRAQSRRGSTVSVDPHPGAVPAHAVLRMPPVVAAPTPEAAIFELNWLSATGTGIFVAAILAGLAMGRRLASWRALRAHAEAGAPRC